MPFPSLLRNLLAAYACAFSGTSPDERGPV